MIDGIVHDAVVGVLVHRTSIGITRLASHECHWPVSRGIVRKYLIHDVRQQASPRRGVSLSTAELSNYFVEAWQLAGVSGDDTSTFHEIRILSMRSYVEQGSVYTKALLGHNDDKTAALYGNSQFARA
ncbi:hypothetical protein [Burkholderia diffusa]|uniref:hypothetical protein n=1 Tax=Burkholderia diffusa TaxID=488732 RepID=UPI0007565F4B|nr:hypothetical protein [Burkholderia diffusa]KVH48567.1 hypothetical protein WJ39_11845 [Burkholderia diffusa]